MNSDSNTVANEEFFKEMDMIQACINRMANNSFLVKGWMITIVSLAFSILYGKNDLVALCAISAFPVFCFWYIDAFFLCTERLYRKKYQWVISQRQKGNREFMFDLNPYNDNMWLEKKTAKPRIIKTMFSRTLLPFYGTPFIILAIIVLTHFVKAF